MGPKEIRAAVSSAAQHYVSHPSEAKSEDKPAKAVLESGLRVRVEGPNSWAVITDMPHGLGGGGRGPSPGWLRAPAERLRQRIEWAEAHSPVTDSLTRSVPHRLHVDVQ